MQTSGKRALIVGDMQRDFMQPGGALFCGLEAKNIIPRVCTLVDEWRKNGELITFVLDAHQPDDLEFDLWPPHCIKNSHGYQLIRELQMMPNDLLVEKSHYSAFADTNLDQLLRDHNVNEIHLVGVCTSICLLFTAIDAFNHRYRMVVHRDAVADFDEAAQEFALRHMEKVLGARMVESMQFV